MTGLLIGGGLGAIAGYVFYNAVVCEAVDNNCADSPLLLTLAGGAIGGAIGALIGSLID